MTILVSIFLGTILGAMGVTIIFFGDRQKEDHRARYWQPTAKDLK